MGNHPAATGEATTMPGEQGTPEANKPDPNKVAPGLLAQLGIQTQPTPPVPPSNSSNSAYTDAGVTVAQARGADVAEQQSKASTGVAKQHAGDVVEQQKTPAEAESQTGVGGVVRGLLGLPVVGGGSVVVNCRYCPGGCCGGLSGHRLSVDEVELVKAVKELFGFRHECEVLNRWPGLFCRRRGRRRSVKELERLLSRELEYKAGYLFGRLVECRNDAVCVQFLRLGVRGWFDAAYVLAGRVAGDADAYVARLVSGLGFRSVVEAARYLRVLTQGVLDLDFVRRGRGYFDALRARCRICGAVFDLTGPLPAVLFTIVRHAKGVHGLARPEDVEAKAAELGSRVVEYDDARARVLKGIGDVLLLLRIVVHRLEQFGNVERFGRRYRCKICSADVGGVVDVVTHFTNHHLNVLRSMHFSTPTEECEPGDIGADETADPSTLTYRLACALRRQFGSRGAWYHEAEKLIEKLRSGLACSELALANAGFKPAGLYMAALRDAGICF